MRRFALAMLTLLVAVLLVPSAGAQTTNRLRVMHASPDAPAVDIYVNGNAVLTNVPFFSYSSYLPLADGSYDVAVVPTGKPLGDAVLSGKVEVSGGYAGTLAAVNFVDTIEAVLYDDDTSPVPAGKTRVRVIHASPNAPPVDIKLAGTSTALVANAPFKASAYLLVDAGTYSFDVTPAGAATAVYTTPALRFESGWSYTLVATGDLNKNLWVQARVDSTGP